MAASWTHRFLELALDYQALRFGSFTLKSGRVSPYFFNAGLFCDGAGLDRLARCYAEALVEHAPPFDLLFGPAYKGIPLVAAIAVSLARDHGRNLPFAYNRKEAKGHGEGGVVVGAPLAGRVVIVDDVISAGTSISESITLIRAAGAEPVAAAIALDRQERGPDERSAIQAVSDQGLAVVSLAKLDDLIDWAGQHGEAAQHLPALQNYQARYGV
ncbi:MAG: orotate phosphoribosyltransferase [Wenzhouxiangella sp.]